jgi:exodeoxyribonuclease VII large subunit
VARPVQRRYTTGLSADRSPPASFLNTASISIPSRCELADMPWLFDDLEETPAPEPKRDKPKRPTPGSQRDCPLGIDQLNQRIKELLQGSIGQVWVAGELSDLVRPPSGHIYLTLKEAESQIRAVMWRSAAARLDFDLENGQSVLVQGQLDVYSPRGTYQLVIRHIEPVGLGGLQLAFRQLHQRLAAEGLFAAERKRPLPLLPQRIGVITSPSGAAIRDFLRALEQRWSTPQVVLIPARVQGAGASEELAEAIRAAHRLHPRPDVLVVGRGGGSLEDLWCFNEEPLVRAVAASEIPVVSAVGHEIDVTLCDLAADVRALTPTDAARHVMPDQRQLRQTLNSWQTRCHHQLRSRLDAAWQRIDWLAGRPVIAQPLQSLATNRQQLTMLRQRADRSLTNWQASQRQRLAAVASQLEALSPLGTLARGYSLTRQGADGPLLTSSDRLAVGDLLMTQLAQGQLLSRIEQIVPAAADAPLAAPS